MSSEPSVLINSSSHQSSLLLNGVQAEHFGQLSVVAENAAGRAVSSSHISRAARVGHPEGRPPLFIHHLTPFTLKDGDEAKLSCQVSGEPLPELTWFKDGVNVETWVANKDTFVSLVPSPLPAPIGRLRRWVQKSDGWASLYFAEVFPEDSGLYTAVARNAAGSAHTQARLVVEGTSSSPALFPSSSPP